MNDPVMLWILAGGAFVVAIVLGVAWRGALRRLTEVEETLASLRAERDKLEKKVDSLRQAADARTEEMEALRKKLKKAKKRAASVHQEHASGAGRQAALEEELQETREALDRAKEALEALRAEAASKKGSQHEQAGDDAPATSPPAKPPKPEVIARLEERARRAEAQLSEARRTLEETRAELKRARGRAQTNHRVFVVTKLELEAVNERLRTLERHLGATSFRDLLRKAGAAVGTRGGLAIVPDDPEAPAETPAEEASGTDPASTPDTHEAETSEAHPKGARPTSGEEEPTSTERQQETEPPTTSAPDAS